ncbi:MAG: hypothetical protein DRP81_04095 [Candidatus Omnitrophota bacterium]|nr:MAG: hypothetical protein DRP72_04420 [Candidatus Omnitrophota bacterium]RKY45349.1 MAG: hypothetical protein DRP81_04095 [Candidatus Omnitrophota bacterium]
MKEQKGNVGVVVAIIVLFLLVGAIGGASYYFYNQQNKKVSQVSGYYNLINKKLTLLEDRVDNFTSNLKKIKNSLNSLSSQINTYSKDLILIESRLDTGDMERKKLVSKLLAITDSIDNLRNMYADTLAGIFDDLESLRTQIKKVKGNVPGESISLEKVSERVELGEISVEKK